MKKFFMLAVILLVCGQMEAMSKLFGKEKTAIYENDKYTFKPIYSIEESTRLLENIVESCAVLAELRAVNNSDCYSQRELTASAGQAWTTSQGLHRAIAEYQRAKHQSSFYWQEEALLENFKRRYFGVDLSLKVAQEQTLNDYFGKTLTINNGLREEFDKFKPQENQ